MKNVVADQPDPTWTAILDSASICVMCCHGARRAKVVAQSLRLLHALRPSLGAGRKDA